MLYEVSDILESGSSSIVRFVRLVYLSIGALPKIFGNFESPTTQYISTQSGAASLTSGRFNPPI